jgi:uncharacterized cupredoxin-like copper-binding protein
VLRRSCTFRVLGPLAVVAAILAFAQAAFGGTAAQQTAARSATVTAGKPSEFGFRLTAKTFAVGKVTFTVVNAGVLPHSFRVCSQPALKATANSCAAKGTTKTLSPGQTAKLTVTFTKQGNYEYLCTVSGHAAGGMKGIFKVV